jgi:hypothetical protein
MFSIMAWSLLIQRQAHAKTYSGTSPYSQVDTMKMQMQKLAASLVLAGGMFAGQAMAASIDFFGATFDLQLGSGSGDTWDVIYSADFTNFNATHDGKNSAYLTHINWNWSGYTVTVNNVTPESGPYSYGNLNSNGCGGGSGSFVCLDLDPDLLTTGNSYAWTFNVTFDKALAEADMDSTGNALRARFADSTGRFDDLMSCQAGRTYERCTRNEVPVPGTLGLLGLGLIGLGMARRKQAA